MIFQINVFDDLNTMSNSKKLFSEIIFLKFAFLEKKIYFGLDFVFVNKNVSVCINIFKKYLYPLRHVLCLWSYVSAGSVSGTSTVI